MDLKMGFIAVPKAATIALARGFFESNGVPVWLHNREFKQWADGTPGRMKAGTVVCVMRDPVDRVVSAYCYLMDGGRNGMDKADFARYCEQFPCLDAFVHDGLERASQVQLHFRPQAFWITPPGHDVDLGKIEALRFHKLQRDTFWLARRHGLKWSLIARQNESKREGVTLGREAAAKIRRIYAEDLELMRVLTK